MQDVKKFKERLARQLRNLPSNAANREVFIERIEQLYTKMLEEKVARQGQGKPKKEKK